MVAKKFAKKFWLPHLQILKSADKYVKTVQIDQ
jgi:hypothetical protein